MTEIYIKKTLQGWKPADETSELYWKKAKLGDIHHFDVKLVQKQRNWRLLQKYWVMLQKVVDNHPKYRYKEDLHHDIKWALDLVEIRRDVKTGQAYRVVMSIAMDKMDEEKFERFYSDAINIILEFILPDVSREELDAAVNEVLQFA